MDAGFAQVHPPLPGRAAVITLDGPVDWQELDLQRLLLVPVAEPAPIGWLKRVRPKGMTRRCWPSSMRRSATIGTGG